MKKPIRVILVLAVLALVIYLVVRAMKKNSATPNVPAGTINTPASLGQPINTSGVQSPIPWNGKYIQGAYGDEVRVFQQYLKDRGHPVAVDGVIGPQTAAAMAKEFDGSLVVTQAQFEDHAERNPTGVAGKVASFESNVQAELDKLNQSILNLF